MNENDRIYEILVELRTHASVTNERLATYNEQLDVHIKRTELLEKDMQTALLPIRLAKVLVASAAGAAAILAIFKHFKM